MPKPRRLSTTVDNKESKTRAPRVPAAQTRERIQAAAWVLFCQAGFDQVGVREIARKAKVDPAVVIRLFGSKEALFAGIAQTAFTLEGPFNSPVEELAATLAQHLVLHAKKHEHPDDGLNDFHFLLRSVPSPIAGPILSKVVHETFIKALADRLGEPQASLRAAMLTAALLGFATLQVALRSPDLKDDEAGSVSTRLAAVFEACLATP